jgi:hypothetical protein
MAACFEPKPACATGITRWRLVIQKKITVHSWQSKTAVSYSAEITVHSSQSYMAVFLAEINIYNW